MLLHGWWKCKMVQLLWKRVWQFLKAFSIQSLYDAAILLLSIFPRDMKAHVHTHTHKDMRVYSLIIHNY